MKIGRYIDTRYDVLSCPHGEVREAGVRCGDSLFRHQPRLLEAFHALRARRGAPIAITSGFRCAGCQARLRRSPRYRAAARSEHEYNVALDLRPWRYRARPEGGWSEGEKKASRRDPPLRTVARRDRLRPPDRNAPLRRDTPSPRGGLSARAESRPPELAAGRSVVSRAGPFTGRRNKMTDFKNWYASKGVWGGIVALLAGGGGPVWLRRPGGGAGPDRLPARGGGRRGGRPSRHRRPHPGAKAHPLRENPRPAGPRTPSPGWPWANSRRGSASGRGSGARSSNTSSPSKRTPGRKPAASAPTSKSSKSRSPG